MRQVQTARYCDRPVRWSARWPRPAAQTSEVREVFSTDHEPDSRLLKACGDRRSSRCRSCSEVYRADAWQLIAARLRGGKGVPETVADHPRVFVTFTAPSFEPVHAQREHQGKALPCRPRGPLVRCRHGQPVGCWAKHAADDPVLGTPLYRGCFDYEAAVLWNALAAVWLSSAKVAE